MALTETRPETEIADALDSTPTAVAFDELLGSGDHKTTGRLWILTGSLMLLAGLVLSIVASVEQVDLSGFAVVDDQGRYTQFWSLGRELVFFGGLLPVLIGLATFIAPLQVGSSSLAFPRGANAAFWTWFLSIDLMILSYILNGGAGGGRVDYVVLWAASLIAATLALIWALVCVATTVLGARATGMSLKRVPVSTWGFFVFSIGGLFVLPLVVAQLVVSYLWVEHGFLADRISRTSLLGVTDSVSLAPAVFWIGVPVLGIAAEAISVHTGAALRFRTGVMAALGLMSVTTFAGEVLTFGFGAPDFHNGLLVAGILAAAIPVLAVLGMAGESLRAGSFVARTPLVAALFGGLALLLGSLAAVLGTVWPIVEFIETNFDTSVNLDSAFNVNGTSFHDGLRGLAVASGVLGAIAGVHHWGHKIWGRSLDDRMGLLASVTGLLGGVLWATGAIASGFLEQPALPMAAADPQDGVEALNGVATAGIALVAVSALLLIANAARTATGGGSSNEPWRGSTLEWATASPPVAANFPQAPVVSSAEPLADGPVFREETAAGDSQDNGSSASEADEEASDQ